MELVGFLYSHASATTALPVVLLTRFSVVVSIAAIIILSIIGGLFNVRSPFLPGFPYT